MSDCGTRLLFEFFLDERVRVLTAYEKIDLQVLMVYASRRRQDAGVIPPMPLPRLSRKIGIPPQRLERRLAKFIAEDLVTLREDGGWEVELFDDAGAYDSPNYNAPNYGSQSYGAGGEYADQDVDGPITSGGGRERTRRWRANLKNGGNNGGNGSGGNGHGSDAYPPRSDAQASQNPAEASQNGHRASQGASQGVTQNGHGAVTVGVTGASQPSRTRDDNVQRLSPNLNSNSKQDSTLNDNNVVNNVAAASPVTPSVTPPTSGQSTSSPSLTSQSASNGRPPNPRARFLAAQAIAFAKELGDDRPHDGYPQGNIPCHLRLLSVCEEHGLLSLAAEALEATKKRAANPNREALTKPPAAYYQSTLRRKLGGHGVHVPTEAELAAEPASEVQRLIRESLDAARLPAGVTPLEDILPEMEHE